MKTKVLSVRIDEETYDAFRHACWVLRKSQGELVCRLVQEFTDKNWSEVVRIETALKGTTLGREPYGEV